jgi:quinol monooxygenase YgiN
MPERGCLSKAQLLETGTGSHRIDAWESSLQSKATFAALVVLEALGLSMASATDSSGAVGILTFIDVRAAASAQAASVLQRAARDSHRELLKEIARPDRFVVIEPGVHEPAATGPSEDTLPSQLGVLLVAPADRRIHHEFGEPAADQTMPGALAHRAVYLIAHVDIGGANQPAAQDALRVIEKSGRASAGNLRFEVWQQTNRTNHYNIVAAWKSAADLDAFEASSAARDFRKIVAPLIGSLYDERRYRRVD